MDSILLITPLNVARDTYLTSVGQDIRFRGQRLLVILQPQSTSPMDHTVTLIDALDKQVLIVEPFVIHARRPERPIHWKHERQS